MLKSFLIANPKGGSGKSTLATNLAGYFARQGHRVMLGDIDRQQSAREWLKMRPDILPPIRGWQIDPDPPPLAGHPIATEDAEPIDYAMKLVLADDHASPPRDAATP